MQNTKWILGSAFFALVLSLTACGGGGSGAGGGGGNGSLSASSFFKTGVGDTWTYSGTSTSGTTTLSFTQTDTNTALVNGVVTSVTTSSTTPPITSTHSLDVNGNLIAITNGVKTTALPSAISVGANWTWQAASGVTPAIPATITAINVSRTVPAGTFNDCVEVTMGPYVVGSLTITVLNYMSPTVGGSVEVLDAGTSTSIHSTADLKLQHGYIAN